MRELVADIQTFISGASLVSMTIYLICAWAGFKSAKMACALNVWLAVLVSLFLAGFIMDTYARGYGAVLAHIGTWFSVGFCYVAGIRLYRWLQHGQPV